MNRQTIELFNRNLRNIHTNFLNEIVPFGRAGTDKDFREVAALFEKLMLKWKNWYRKKREENK